jgi:hypothetical protein
MSSLQRSSSARKPRFSINRSGMRSGFCISAMQQSPPFPDRHPGRQERHRKAYSHPIGRALDGRASGSRQTHSRRPGPQRPAHRGRQFSKDFDRSLPRETGFSVAHSAGHGLNILVAIRPKATGSPRGKSAERNLTDPDLANPPPPGATRRTRIECPLTTPFLPVTSSRNLHMTSPDSRRSVRRCQRENSRLSLLSKGCPNREIPVIQDIGKNHDHGIIISVI